MILWASLAFAAAMWTNPDPSVEVNAEDIRCEFSKNYQSSAFSIATGNILSVAKLRKSAAEGNVEAQMSIGDYYADGVGVCQNDHAAFLWHQRAAQNNSSAAQYSLAWAYAHGRGVQKDLVKSFYWALLAASNLNPGGELLAGLDYIRGDGTDKNEANGAQFIRTAAQNGLGQAQAFLGILYADGIGVPKNIDDARNWLSMAERQGQKVDVFLDRLKNSSQPIYIELPCPDGGYAFKECDGS